MSDQPPLVTQPEVTQTVVTDETSLNRDSEVQRRSDEGYSWIAACLWLGGSLTILSLAAILSVGPSRHVYLPGVSVPLPETCMMHARFGIDCPGCGLTRSFIHLAHGRIFESLSVNPAGIAIFLFVAAQIPAASLRFAYGRSSRVAIWWSRCNEIALVILPILTCIQWIVRMVLGTTVEQLDSNTWSAREHLVSSSDR